MAVSCPFAIRKTVSGFFCWPLTSLQARGRASHMGRSPLEGQCGAPGSLAAGTLMALLPGRETAVPWRASLPPKGRV